MTKGLEAIVGLEKLTIHQCEALAKDLSVVSSGGRENRVCFDLCGPKGKLPAHWLDPYMGLFQIDGEDGFMMTQQVEFAPHLWCENVRTEHS